LRKIGIAEHVPACPSPFVGTCCGCTASRNLGRKPIIFPSPHDFPIISARSSPASAHGASAASVLGLLSASGAAVARRGTRLRRGPYGGYGGGGYGRSMSAEEQADARKNT